MVTCQKCMSLQCSEPFCQVPGTSVCLWDRLTTQWRTIVIWFYQYVELVPMLPFGPNSAFIPKNQNITNSE